MMADPHYHDLLSVGPGNQNSGSYPRMSTALTEPSPLLVHL